MNLTELMRQKGINTNSFEFVTAMSILVISLSLCLVCVYDSANIELIFSHYVLILSEFAIVFYVFSCFFFDRSLLYPFIFISLYFYYAISNWFENRQDNQIQSQQKSGKKFRFLFFEQFFKLIQFYNRFRWIPLELIVRRSAIYGHICIKAHCILRLKRIKNSNNSLM
ncbi:hypothetical protein HUJ04_004179 [Dendroctonus ponderosae]|nr:hypothetical protein HUJ04_004179 [Dendroctonus ponderosae]